VRIPLAVFYRLENDQIKRADVYLEIPAFLRQVGAVPAASPSRASQQA
jgi:hypothetical protein